MALYGVHLTQILQYAATRSKRMSAVNRPSASIWLHVLRFLAEPSWSGIWSTNTLLCWVYSLSTFQIVIILISAHHYFIRGLSDPAVWGSFYWALSVQDGLIPIIAATAQGFFLERVWRLTGRKWWVMWGGCAWIVIAGLCGIGLAVSAHFYSIDPASRYLARLSFFCCLTWMILSGGMDLLLTICLLLTLKRAKTRSSPLTHPIIHKLQRLTLETVLLTHLMGAAMCVIYLAGDSRWRTGGVGGTGFWILLEVIGETWALSIVWTINARSAGMKEEGDTESEATLTGIDVHLAPPMIALNGQDEEMGKHPAGEPEQGSVHANDCTCRCHSAGSGNTQHRRRGRRRDQMRSWLQGGSALDRKVEGYQGNTPFGVSEMDLELYRIGLKRQDTQDVEEAAVGLSTNGTGRRWSSERPSALRWELGESAERILPSQPSSAVNIRGSTSDDSGSKSTSTSGSAGSGTTDRRTVGSSREGAWVRTPDTSPLETIMTPLGTHVALREFPGLVVPDDGADAQGPTVGPGEGGKKEDEP